VLTWLKLKVGCWALPAMQAELDAAREEMGGMAEAIEDLDGENSALLAALKATHEKDVGTILALVEFVNAAVLVYGNEAGELRLSGDTRAVAASSPDPTFEELPDGDVVIRIPSETEAAEPLTEGDE